jgi:hypothetical protein
MFTNIYADENTENIFLPKFFKLLHFDLPDNPKDLESCMEINFFFSSLSPCETMSSM